MFGFLFIYWIWKAFSNLAITYKKNKWKYFFFGIGSYLFVLFFSAIIFVFIMGILNGFDALESNDYEGREYDLLFTVFAVLGCYGTYKFLEHKGQKEKELEEKDEIENIGLMEEN
ncbi:hypothetical protein GKZ90_0020450 [Flavobacterium sp. MC2016-06]|uniref:hypothetical protein n=1 Tax=Flavobacterium sp. MC2016-06 TaxID=2676308 RepID=UPI0012BA9F72|nr:hypothetical protein [Flavobacterium sp. MC2016-06]MBU3862458.1 hypothetical protein [Flavobacterium sp. MC2016-06]